MGLIPRLLCLLGGLLPAIVSGATAPTPFFPELDDFYKPKQGFWEELDPGSIIDWRRVYVNSLSYGIPSNATAYQLLYVTRDLNEKKTHSVTTIIVPHNAQKGWLLSVQPAYDSPDINCSPSYGLQVGAVGPALSWNMMDLSFVLPFVNKHGPILNIPDYEGWNAAFTVGPQTAYHTLDSIRAAFNFQKEYGLTGLKPDARTVMYGFSGGAYATEWASELQPTYAPELTQIVGAAMGGPPPNITDTYLGCNEGPWAELNVWAMLGVMNAVPEVKKYMDNDLLEEHRERFYGPKTRCSRCLGREPAHEPLEYQNISSYFEHGHSFLSRFRRDLTDIGVMGRHGAPAYPMYIFQGTNDEIVGDIDVTNKLVCNLCDKGTVVQYHQHPGLNHMQTLQQGNLDAWRWILNRFLGVPPTGCREKDLNPPIGGACNDLKRVEDDLMTDDGSDAQIPLRAELK
ncbi:secretory lipase-domain-containing protein [Aspergillus pseudotamarii]|uniref:Secretory lipase-domain-containing protein n=1 Tax=Aspergillus pseudotamarii TaxID=132259 RepID=A0A5N6TBI5_ASPPS|nr:secretory lipase-domain-containing protein [Aspergillus pseudotamarii]KAE8143481.1 secretory lipase-domain-containing protein [Aspergillus pseudotamarii]